MKKSDPQNQTEYASRLSPDGLVPLMWNSFIRLDIQESSPAAQSPTSALHVEFVWERDGKSEKKGIVGGKIVLPLSLLAASLETPTKLKWLPVNSMAGEDSLEDGVRLNLSWCFVPSAASDLDQKVQEMSMAVTTDELTQAQPVQPGKLFVQVLEARDLRDPQWVGTSDPFPEAILCPGSESARMPACTDGGENPHWDWTTSPPWTFLVEDLDVASLTVNLFNEKSWISKKVSGNGMLGSVTIPLAQNALIAHGESKEMDKKWYQLHTPGKRRKGSTKNLRK